jgi:hypothetical protein
MVSFAKRPGLAILAGALWLTSVDRAWAQSSTDKARFAALVGGSERSVNNRLRQQLRLLTAESRGLQQLQNAVTATLGGSGPPSSQSVTDQLEQRLEQQSARILQRLQNLKNLVGSTSLNSSAVGRLRHSLARQEAAITRTVQSIQRLERGAATPSAPGAG